LLNHPEGTCRLNGTEASREQHLNAVTGKDEKGSTSVSGSGANR